MDVILKMRDFGVLDFKIRFMVWGFFFLVFFDFSIMGIGRVSKNILRVWYSRFFFGSGN